ncbi:hypothetical protein KCU77_g144, partial [Aureobasidium melanogenum]
MIIMTIMPPSSSPLELCNRSSTVLATRDRTAPGALPLSLREHPIWGYLVTHEDSAYERDCKVTDAHSYDRSFLFIDGDTNNGHGAQVPLPPALVVRKKDELLEAYSPVKFCIIDADEALNSFKYEKTGSSTLPLEQPPYKVEHATASGKCTAHKLRRKRCYANLRADGAA